MPNRRARRAKQGPKSVPFREYLSKPGRHVRRGELIEVVNRLIIAHEIRKERDRRRRSWLWRAKRWLQRLWRTGSPPATRAEAADAEQFEDDLNRATEGHNGAETESP